MNACTEFLELQHACRMSDLEVGVFLRISPKTVREYQIGYKKPSDLTLGALKANRVVKPEKKIRTNVSDFFKTRWDARYWTKQEKTEFQLKMFEMGMKWHSLPVDLRVVQHLDKNFYTIDQFGNLEFLKCEDSFLRFDHLEELEFHDSMTEIKGGE